MKSTRRFLLPFFLFLSLSISHAQQAPDFICGFDDLRSPTNQSGIQEFEEQLRQHIAQKGLFKDAQKGLSGPPYIIPVVVHIIHDGGAENIPDAQILAAIDHLNDGFTAQGYFAQQGATVNTQIQFCMAKRDPDGNATTGITRNQSPLTNMVMETQDIQTKNINRWNPKEYVNIWVVKEISSQSLGSGVAGYANFPNAHGGPQDGMLCEAKFFGTSPAEDAVLIHEMGHYFGLYHTFEGGCSNNDCTVEGDRVCDTPPDQATHTACNYNSCSTDVAAGSPFLTDVNDFTEDFMDYSPFSCYHFFTAGQALRMQGAVETARASLLNSKGCLDPCTQPLVAAFSAAPNPVSAGQTVVFTNNSSGATNFSWLENGLEFSQNQNPTQVFNTVGNYQITLKVTNSDPNCEDITQVAVEVQCPTTADFSVVSFEIDPGETLVFTNTSTGGATAYEWFINGVSLAATTDFSYLFANSGYYTVRLQATGQACASEKVVQILVKSPCGDPFFVETSYRIGQNNIITSDMVGLPDGSTIVCGHSQKNPMISRLDAVGNIVWHKVLDVTGAFNDIEPLPDGTFVLRGEVNSQFLLAKINDSGNILWFRTLQNPEGLFNGEGGINTIAANPDGSFAFYFSGSQAGSVGKMAANGTVEWMRKFQILNSTGGLQRATDGSGDYLISTITFTLQMDYLVLRINQAGDVVNIYRYVLPTQNINGTSPAYLGVHPDGDFSLIFSSNAFTAGDKYMIRCQPNGQPRWARKIATVGHKTAYVRARYLPGEGWVLSDERASSDNYMIRINEQDEVVWQRKIGTGGFLGDGVAASYKQNGLIRAIKFLDNLQGFRLLQLPETYFPIPCLPDIPKEELITDVPIQMTERGTFVTPQSLQFSPEPYTFLDAPLSRNTLCSAVLPCAEICDNELDDDEDGYVDCFDTDCNCFDVDTACTIIPPVAPLSVQTAWISTQNIADPTTTPFVGNLNPQVDSIPEIIVMGNNPGQIYIYRGDGSNKSSPVSFAPALLTSFEISPPLLADINADGIPELILIGGTGFISVYTNYQENQSPPFTHWFNSSPAATGELSPLGAADFDQDGIPELYMGRQVFAFDFTNPAAPTLSQKVKGTGHAGAEASLNPGNFDHAAAVDMLSKSDCNGDPDCDGLELAAGAHIYSIDLDPNDGDGYQIKIQRNLNTFLPGISFSDGPTQVADMNLDGTPDVVVNGRSQNQQQVYIWDKNGLISSFIAPSFLVNGKVTISNVFDDKTAGFTQDFPEIIWKWNNPQRVVACNLQAQSLNPAQPYWWVAPTDDLSHHCFISAFDFNLDGFDELVSKGDTFIRVYYGGAAPFPPGVNPANRVWFEVPSRSGTASDGAIVADVDGDREAEIVYNWNPGNPSLKNGRLQVLESAAFPWPPARPVWNQYNYFGVHINDDLTVPKVQQKHWLEMGGIGSGKRPFNTHLAQVGSLRQLDNRIKVPDASLTFESVVCGNDSLEVFFKMCNLGSSVLPNGTPLTFYLGDPTTTAAAMLITVPLAHGNLKMGNCTNISLKIPASYNTSIFAVINDDGSLPRPFNLSTDFPSTDQPECQYTNNMVSFSIQNQTPTLDLGPDITLCENSVVELSANTDFIKYRWQNGSTGSKFTAYTPGKYWVDAFDACGFRQTDTLNVVLNTIKTLNLPDVLTACEGEEISLVASGFSKYTWFPADSVSCPDCASVNILATKTITILLTAAEGDCFVTDSVRININPKPSLQLLTQDGDCGTPASITTIAFGDGPFDFLWSNLSLDSVLNTSQSGTYTVSITDQNGCQTSDSVAVIVTNSLAILANSTMPNCSNTQTGSIDLTVNNGTAPFQFLWSNNATTEDLSNTSAGTYSVLTTDANGCTATITETLSDPSAIVLDLQKTDPKCAGANSGALDLSASGGTGTLLFSWSNNSNLEDLNNLSSGVYSLLTTDANGCSATISETLSDPPALVLDLQKTDPKCAGEASGAIDLSASGGTGALQFLWSNNSSLEDLKNLSSGVYSVLTTDVNGCTATILETLNDPPALILGLQKTDPKCAGEASGAIDLSASGGTGALQFLWSNNSNLEDLNNLSSGVYSVLATDANGCTAMLSETLSEPPALVLGLQKTEPKCAGEASGKLDLTAAGGTGTLLFSWSNNSNFEDLNNLSSGVYSVLTTDANGCTATISETLTDPPAMVLDFQKTDLNCPGDLGTIDLTAAGGLSPYTFQWSNGETTEDINILQPGTYTATVKDANGCTFFESTLVSTLGAVPILNLTTDTLTCQKTSGVISATSDLPNTSFLWTGAGGFSAQISSPTISTNGTYSVLATDPLGGCSTVASVFVSLDTTAPTILLASHYFKIPCDQNSSSISAAGSSSGPDFSIQWTATSGGLILSGEQTLFPVVGGSGFYTILIADLSNGCTASDAVEVFQMDIPTGTVTADSVRCFGETNGAIQVVSNIGGTPPFMYSIDNQNFKADPVFENLAAGQYQVFIRDANDCAFISQIEIGQPVPITVELTGDSLVVPGVPANLQAIVHPSNMVPTQIEWSANGVDLAQHQLQQSVQLLQNTLFQINIANENGCSASDTWLVEVEESRKIYVPNVIYPASSSGTNQTFLIFAGLSVREIESLEIFDRWGNQLYSNRNFQPNDESQGWNGTFRGQVVEPGVFVWVAKVVFKDGTVEVLKGDLTVIR